MAYALFDNAELHQARTQEKIVVFERFTLPDGSHPTMTVRVTQETIQKVKHLWRTYNAVEFVFRNKGEQAGKVIDEPEMFCKEVIDTAVITSTGWLTKHTTDDLKHVMDILPARQSGEDDERENAPIIRDVASTLYEAFSFEIQAQAQKDEDAAKN